MVSGPVNYCIVSFCLPCRRVDPILIATVYIDDVYSLGEWGSHDFRLNSFLARLTNGRHPAEYYARHVKNLAFVGCFGSAESTIDGILAICTGVENLMINLNLMSEMKFFSNPKAGLALRRLYVNYWAQAAPWSDSDYSLPVCFRNLTHLHLTDDEGHWPSYTGWEHLTCLTHLAFISCDTGTLQEAMNLLPAIRFVALCHSYRGDQYGYIDVVIHDTPELDLRVVLLSNLPPSDWEYGARGKGDFWNAVEDEVERRLREGQGQLPIITL